jgi:hypothetical protein
MAIWFAKLHGCRVGAESVGKICRRRNKKRVTQWADVRSVYIGPLRGPNKNLNLSTSLREAINIRPLRGQVAKLHGCRVGAECVGKICRRRNKNSAYGKFYCTFSRLAAAL